MTTTWLDWFVRQRAELARAGGPKGAAQATRAPSGPNDGVAAFADEVLSLAKGSDPHASLFCACLMPFLRGFLAAEPRGPDPGPALGLVLTRQTAHLLADADPPQTDPWQRRLFGERPDGDSVGAVYVDVPHGALRLSGGLQLRALLAVPWENPGTKAASAAREDTILVAIVVTAEGAEPQRGVVFAAVRGDKVLAVALPDSTLVGFLKPDGAGTGSAEDELAVLHGMLLERSVRFLRLVLAFHRYGPADAHSAIKTTPPGIVARNRNRPNKGESMFAMVRLSAPAGNLGRPPRNASEGWHLNARQEVSGHFRLQPHGPGGTLRRLIWVDAYHRGPDDAPAKPRAFRL